MQIGKMIVPFSPYEKLGGCSPKCDDLSLMLSTPSAHPELVSNVTASPIPPLSLQDDSSVSSEDMNGAEPTWIAAEQPAVPEPSPPNGERVSNQTATIKEEDGMMIVYELLCNDNA